MYAILDIETTGGNYDEEGITEIAIYRYNGIKITDQFSSLINPLKEIQPFVVKLTGINSKMLQTAPKFFEVAKRIVEITEDCVIVAHNAKFDYRILQTEFRRLGFSFERKTICTVNLSQALLPEQPSFSLGKLARNLGIPFTNRHRAQGDAKVTLKLFELLLEKDSHKEIIKEYTKSLSLNRPPNKYLKIIDKLPSEMGVYYIHNKNKEIVYIGKSVNIKKSILNYLTGDKKKAISIQKEVEEVTFSLTGGELVTLLKVQNEIKANHPLLNRKMKYRIFPIGIHVDNTYDYPKLIVEQILTGKEYLSVFRNKKDAKTALLQLIDKFGLCMQKTSLMKTEGVCYNYEIKKCDGACIAEENPKKYILKVKELIASFYYPHKNFLIIEKGRRNGESAFIYIENNHFKGYGYFELNHQIKSKKQIKSRLISIKENTDVKKLINSFLFRKNYLKLIPLQEDI